MGVDLADECVDEEGDAGTVEGVLGRARWGEEGRGVGIGEELSDDAGFEDHGAIVGKTGDQAALHETKLEISLQNSNAGQASCSGRTALLSDLHLR